MNALIVVLAAMAACNGIDCDAKLGAVPTWPGWCFYASSEMNPRNPVWRDAKYLNACA